MSNTKYIFNHASLSDVGLVRQLNEDRELVVRINSDCIAYIVCDGMGGHDSGDKASEAAVRFISEYLTTKPIENTTIALVNAIKFANQQIYFESKVSPTSKGMGTTAVVMLQYQDEVHIGHIGDSRAYLLHNNQLAQITKDHSVVQGMVDQGLISASQAEHHPRKNEITKALGIRENEEPSISKNIKAVKGDRLVLCSDGLSGLISHEVFESTLVTQTDPKTCAKQLINLAKQGGGHDNITVQVIDVVESPHKQIKESKSNQTLMLSIAAGFVGLIVLSFFGLNLIQNQFFGGSGDEKEMATPSQRKGTSNTKLKNSISEDSLENVLHFTNEEERYKDLLEDQNYKELKKSNVIAKYDSVHKRFVLSELLKAKIKQSRQSNNTPPKVKPVVKKKTDVVQKNSSDTTKKGSADPKVTVVIPKKIGETDTSKKNKVLPKKKKKKK
ncbi:Stp1/IreP family PP2C-type Ser/Thr phosphatase [Aquirufa sp. HETE-83D]|uniref:Stp1/IreP family PP2C-type Ser/Thr phosphatase n=1 Tax=Aquirufa esocilacus TaxID=3096513 RepID=A0ABW6DGU8_9BACT